eukprot:TRINITY_DN1401_c0_g1_i1.p1 TRINITY_DN1401_c0_g1~~TRINITY_DN1401_c0_g1_i1.p1  ORF type:complete len:251 (-),score=70.84 TRINITY_DN1401_c0_g1_i1:60-812(-)
MVIFHRFRVSRSKSISISFTDEDGKKKELNNLDAATSELLQHEIDHLDGILALDRVQDPKNDIISRQFYEKNRKELDSKVDYAIQSTITIVKKVEEKKKQEEPQEFTVSPFVLVIVQRPSDKKFLAVLETRNRGWWLPAGHVEYRETLEMAAHRETLEEAGIKIQLESILKIEWNPRGRMRVIFFAKPIDDTPPKSIADSESEKAQWVSIEELEALGRKPPFLRGDELLIWAKYVKGKGKVYPLSVLGPE